ncbi:hypothetical protein M2T82_14275 [Elizabethkingia ursingii]|uniref:hypothetical protein n=1 Tax=Elizabethkingia ursingii TaxID=1756150 RepID=UPI002011D46C|nr:hypothetical protein [Elizabethkingia ursingii]MCL1669230.1 hypothetical protein [Elizabethkingia ursingii]
MEGNATLVPQKGIKNSTAALLNPGENIEQYIYLTPETTYRLELSSKNKGIISIEDVAPVTGALSPIKTQELKGQKNYSKQHLEFITGKDQAYNMKTIRISVKNTGSSAVLLDDIIIKKIK